MGQEAQDLRREYIETKGKGRLALSITLYGGYAAVTGLLILNLYRAGKQPLIFITVFACLFAYLSICAYNHVGLAVLMMRDRMALAASGADPERQIPDTRRSRNE